MPTSPPDSLAPGWLDRRRFESVAEDCGWSLGETAEFYVRGTRDLLAQIGAALAAGNARQLRRLAHGCIGSSATCGIRIMTRQFGDIENAALEGRLEDAASSLRRAEQLLELVAAALP